MQKVLHMRSTSTNRSRGVTIVELMIVVTVIGVLAGLLFSPLNDLYVANLLGLNSIVQTADTRGALRTIEKEITKSNKFLSTNSIPDITGNTPYATTAWNWQGNPVDPNKQVLITENYATRRNDGKLVNTISNGVTCDAKLMVNYVYFVYDGTLYRRLLKKIPTPVDCADGAAVQQLRTCGGTFVNSNCEGRDARIVSGVTKFSVSYYLASNSMTPSASPSGAKTIVITLETTGSKTYKTTSTMRLTRINGT